MIECVYGSVWVWIENAYTYKLQHDTFKLSPSQETIVVDIVQLEGHCCFTMSLFTFSHHISTYKLVSPLGCLS